MGLRIARLPEEQEQGETQRIGDRKGRGDRRHHRHQPGQAEQAHFQRFAQHQFLRDETAQRRQARHRGGGQRRQRRRDRHHLGKPAQPADVARARFVIDDARRHEQGGLERRVVENVQHRDGCRRFEREAQQHDQQAELADGRIGENALQIVLEERHPRAERHGNEAHAGHDNRVEIGARQHRPETRDQEHARLHHGGRMEIGADGRGCGHRVRQPEMERELGRLGETAEQDQDQDRGIERRALHCISARQNRRQIERSDGQAQHDHARDQQQAAPARNRQRHARTLPRFRLVAPEPDEEERGQARQLPEDQEQQDVAGNHDPQHRALEQHQAGEEPPRRLTRGEVEMTEDHHQQSDAQDHSGEHQSERIDHQRQIEAESGHPGDRCHRGSAAQDRRRERDDDRKADRARQRGDARMPDPPAPAHNGNRQRSHERERDEQEQCQWNNHRQERSPIAGI